MLCGVNLFDVWKRGVSDAHAASICVTKSGYIPKQIKLALYQNKTIKAGSITDKNVVLLGSSLTSDVRNGEVVIKGDKINIEAESIIIDSGVVIDKDGTFIIKTN